MHVLLSGDGSGKKKLIKLIIENKESIKIELPKRPWEEDNKKFIQRLNKSISSKGKKR